MGIKASDDLFQLVKAMSPAEKRAFRLLSERHARQDGNNYLLLLDAIAAQATYDEAALRKQLEGKAMLNNLAEAKSYLYHSILRSMRFSKGAESPETELREVLDHLELLHGKGLIDQAERQVKVGLEKAAKLDLHAFTAEFLRWQRRLVKWRGGKSILQELAVIGKAEADDLMGRLQTLLAQQVGTVSPTRSAELQEIWAHDALRQPPVASGFHALSAYYYAHAYYHRMQGDAVATLDAWVHVVATYDAHAIQIKRQLDQYTNALASLIDAQLNGRQLQRIPDALARLRQLKAREPQTMARMFFLEQHLSIRYALVTGRLSDALPRVPELEAGMLRYSKYLSASLEMTFLYNLCALYFLAERYPECQRYINLALNRPQISVREDLVDALRMLEMIARYVRGQQDVVEHLHRAHERRLRLRETKHPFSQLALRFVGRLLAAVDAAETRHCIAEARGDLQTMAQSSKPAGFDELNYWVRSRLEGRRIEQIVQQDT
jgi:hypothetical protein